MKFENGKIVCAACGALGAKLLPDTDTSDITTMILKCMSCNREVACSSLKVMSKLFGDKTEELLTVEVSNDK